MFYLKFHISTLIKVYNIIINCFVFTALLFVYLLFKVGIIQCIGRNLCKMTWAACKTYWIAMEGMSCFLWHKINNSNRNHRRKFEYLEEGFSTTSSNEDEDGDYLDNYRSVRVMRRRRGRRRRSLREKRREEMQRSLYHVRHSFKGKRNHMRMKTRDGDSNKNSLMLFKRRRII